jgi:hypothetical protein
MNQLDNVIEAIEDRDNNLYRTYFNTSHIKEERKSGLSGTDRYADLQGYITQLVLTPQKGRCSCQRISHTIEIAGLHSKAGKKNKLLSAIPAIQPVRNEKNAWLLVLDTDPFTKARKMHEGMDFTAKIGPNLCNWRRYRSAS